MAGIFLNGQLYATDIPDKTFIRIHPWSPGNSYEADDVVLNAYYLYQCLVDNSDNEFNSAKWKKIGAYDGDYGIVSTISHLPSTFGAGDTKVFYCIADMSFYIWDGTQWIKQQKIATYESLGFVKVDEETLNIDANGTLSIRYIQNNTINSLF